MQEDERQQVSMSRPASGDGYAAGEQITATVTFKDRVPDDLTVSLYFQLQDHPLPLPPNRNNEVSISEFVGRTPTSATVTTKLGEIAMEGLYKLAILRLQRPGGFEDATPVPDLTLRVKAGPPNPFLRVEGVSLSG
jgi:hypothetical protein